MLIWRKPIVKRFWARWVHPSTSFKSSPTAKIVQAARGADKALIEDIRVFDVFEGPSLGEGKKSLAITAVLQPTEKTLTDEDIEAVSQKIVAAVEKAAGGVLRG